MAAWGGGEEAWSAGVAGRPDGCPLPPSRAMQWVMATTRSYIMVLKTTYKDPGSGKELCGSGGMRRGGGAVGHPQPAPQPPTLDPPTCTPTHPPPAPTHTIPQIYQQDGRQRARAAAATAPARGRAADRVGGW